MKKASVIALLLALCLLLTACGPRTVQEEAVSSPEEPEITVPEPEPEPEEDPLPQVSAAHFLDAFQKGNEAYKSEDWRLAEAYYLMGLQMAGAEDSRRDMRNNYGLVLLQEGRNEEAFAVYRELIGQDHGNYGYWMNLLVAGHACGYTVEDLFSGANNLYLLEELVELRNEDPGEYQTLLYGIYFNLCYMDAELDEEHVTGRIVDYYAPLAGNDPVLLGDNLIPYPDPVEHLDNLCLILTYLNDQNETEFEYSDKDYYAMIEYLDAKLYEAYMALEGAE